MKKRLYSAGHRVRIRFGLHAGVPGTIESVAADGKLWVSHESPFFLPDGPEGTVLLPYDLDELEPVLRAV